jgi:TolB protein
MTDTSPVPVLGAPAFVHGRQVSQLTVIDRSGLHQRVIHESHAHIEAPNWSHDGAWLLFNSLGRLFKIRADGGGPAQEIETEAALQVNNDHVLSPDGRTVYCSVRGGHVYAVPWTGGAARRVSNVHPPEAPLRYFVHGISPDGATLVYVGITGPMAQRDYGVYAIATAGGPDVALLRPGVPVDGPEYSPDGHWVYYNAEDPARAPGHAQIYRMRPDGNGVEQLTHDQRVNWFPHVSPNGRWVAYLSYPSGTCGHPPNRPVTIRVMQPDGRGGHDVVALLGGQGTLNVNSWAPDSERFAYVAYPETRTT